MEEWGGGGGGRRPRDSGWNCERREEGEFEGGRERVGERCRAVKKSGLTKEPELI